MNRRDFLRDSAAVSVAAAMAMSAAEAHADKKAVVEDDPTTPPITCAVIGASSQGREILASLAKLGAANAPIAAVCDTYDKPSFLRKISAIAPSAKFVKDYRQVLDDKAVQAVFIATPSHKHKQIAIDALAAGKHVYCEAPLAIDLAEAKEMARAGRDAKTCFQPGIQVRSNLQHQHVLKFLRSGALGTIVSGRAQWHSRDSWKRAWPEQARADELNWRLAKESSNGLLGEIGIHQIDTASWFLNSTPLAVTGFSSLKAWNDGRTIPDTVEVVLEYPNDVRYIYDATLSGSFEGTYELFYGTGSTVMTRDQRAWMFKESDANNIGWEGFARKDDMTIGKPENNTGIRTGTGIALVADATKQLALGHQPGEVGTDVSNTALYQAIVAFFTAIRRNKKPSVGPLEGYQATVVASKCNEAALTQSRIKFEPEWFTL